MNLGLGPATVSLEDGLGSWNASAADALAIWNGYLGLIHISSVSSATVPQRSGDGVNSVFFSTTVFGDSFGEGTLAVTVLLGRGTYPYVESEADVVVNSAYRYNSYRGPLHSDRNGRVFDLHRVFLHEFGHVLDLDHVAPPLKGTEIMEPVISNWDHLAANDIASVQHIYGADFYFPPEARTTRIGFSFYDLFSANNSPTSYSATSLPPGLTLNSATGVVTGFPTKGGIYNGIVTAHGHLATSYTSFQFTVLGPEEIPGLVKIVPLGLADSMIADPIRPRIYAAESDRISMIDMRTFAVTDLLSYSPSPFHLSISRDSSKLFFTTISAPEVQENRIDLESLTLLSPLPLVHNNSSVIEGLNNLAYVGSGFGVDQIDATTGALQQSFAPGLTIAPLVPAMTISPDRKTLFLARDTENGDLSSYDISTPNPVLLRQLSGSFLSAVPSSDGQFLYYIKYIGNGSSLSQAHLPALTAVRSLSFSHILGVTTVAANGSVYQCHGGLYNQNPQKSGSIVVYDPATMHQAGAVYLDNLLVPGSEFYPYELKGLVFDHAGRYFFALVRGFNGSELWVFSRNAPSLPPLVHPTKNLLNISTRGRVEAGENAMIGGFIVQGAKPKKVTIRGLGPSLPITGAMSNPVLELYDSSGRRLASNDNWTSNKINILKTLLPPSSPRESVITMTLPPGAYTTIVRDLNNQPGLALIEVYDTDPKNSRLANISTRGKVGTGDNVLIGGFIVGGADPTKMVIRAIGPSLAAKGIGYPLTDPTLELHDGNGKLIARNDNWRTTQSSQIIATGIPPTDNRESAILVTLRPGHYTAIVRGKNSATGVALVEVYNLDSSTSPVQ